nr:transport facilitation protein [uncultured bacterium]
MTSGLGVAFDTTALALTLSMILMFGQFLIDRLEGAVLTRVDDRAAAELTGRFEVTVASRDPHLAGVERMTEAVIHAVEQLVARQATVWYETIDAAHGRWNDLTTASQQTMEAALSNSLTRSLQVHAEQLAGAESAAAQQNRKHWGRLRKTLAASTEVAQAQHAELIRQGEVLMQVVEATGQVKKLEEALNRNLATLAGTQHFNETMHNLSAAIHLLNARLGQMAPLATRVDLKHDTVGKAA